MGRKKDSGTGCLILIVGILSLASVVGISIFSDLSLDRNCVGRLKRAADANQPERAIEELDVALAWVEDKHKPEEGDFTSIFYETPDEDVFFWFENLTEARDDLANLPEDADAMTVSNALMKLRETLLDDGADGASVTYPSGLHVYPNNGAYFWWLIASILVVLIGGVGCGIIKAPA